MKLPKRNRVSFNKKLKIVLVAVWLVLSFIYLIAMSKYIDGRYEEDKERLAEIEEINNEIQISAFRDKEVYIITYADTLYVENVKKLDTGGYEISTHYGNLKVENWNEKEECITVFVDIEGNLKWIGDIDKEKNIKYAIKGYKRVNDNTVLINSRANKKKYYEYKSLLDRRDELEELNELEKKQFENSCKKDKKYVASIVLVFTSIFIIVIAKGLVKRNETV